MKRKIYSILIVLFALIMVGCDLIPTISSSSNSSSSSSLSSVSTSSSSSSSSSSVSTSSSSSSSSSSISTSSSSISTSSSSSSSSSSVSTSSNSSSSVCMHTQINWNITAEPTCTTKGSKEEVCEICKKVLSTDLIEKLGHDYKDIVIEPTKETQGYTTHTCDRCKDSYVDTYINFQDVCEHKETRWNVVIKATCQSDGLESEYCLICDKNLQTRSIDALDHNSEENVFYPSIDENGYILVKCKDCSYEEIKYSLKDIYNFYYYLDDNNEKTLEVSAIQPMHLNLFSTLLNSDLYTIKGEMISTNEITKIVLGENIVTVSDFDSIPSLKIVVFGEEIEEIDNYTIYNCGNIKELHFLGDEPKLRETSLSINGNFGVKVYVDNNKEGFDSLLFFGYPVESNQIPARGNIDMPIAEYSQKASMKVDEIIKYNVVLSKEKNQEPLMFIPYEIDLYKYKIIKDFTIELVKDCKTEEEKINTIYDWIVSNIEYKEEAMLYGPYETLSTKTAVCSGYTSLMHDMLASIEIYSFYISGSIVFGSELTTKQLLKDWDNNLPNAHALLGVYKEDGSIRYYDPTWGVSNKEEYRSMTVDQFGRHMVPIEIEGINIVIDDFSYCMYSGIIQFLHTDGYIYVADEGVLEIVNELGSRNGYLSFFMKQHTDNTGEININNIYQPLGTIRINGLTLVSNQSKRYYGGVYCRCDGRAFNMSHIYHYFYIENRFYNNNIMMNYDNYIIEGDFLYYKNIDNTLSMIRYLGNDKDVVVPSNVNSMFVSRINQDAFMFNTTVESITFSEGIKYIEGQSIFYNANLKEINIPESVIEISKEDMTYSNSGSFFLYCPSLEAINVALNNPNYQSIDGNLYSKDGKILYAYASNNPINFEFNDGLEYIYHYAFNNSNIKEITIPSNIILGQSVFSFSSKLEKVVISEGIQEISELAFEYCQSLKEVYLPSTIRNIKYRAFGDTYSLYKIELNEGLETIESFAFMNSGIVSIVVPSTVQSIESAAFYETYRLKEVINLSYLEIEIGSSSNGSIAEFAEFVCSNMNESKYLEIDDYVMFDNYLLGYIGTSDTLVLNETINGKKYILNEYAFFNSEYTLFIQIGIEPRQYKIETYHTYQGIKKIVFSGVVTSIPNKAFCDFVNLEEITVTNELIEISKEAFINSDLKTVNFIGTQEEYDNHPLKTFYDQYNVNIIDEQ